MKEIKSKIQTGNVIGRCRFILTALMMAFLSTSLSATEKQVSQLSNDDLPSDVTGYETINVSLQVDNYDPEQGKPYMPKVKYNKVFPLVITSDDMGKGELINNWATMNGYPVVSNEHGTPSGDEFLSVPYNSTYNQESSDVTDYPPLTFTDGTDKLRRFNATSAIWADNAENNNYTLMNAKDAKVMVRTGWSFAFHDVNDCDVNDAASIKARFQPLSEEWAKKTTGIGLKVMVEPNGNHVYTQAAKESDEIAMSILQNPTTDYPKMSDAINDWTTGTDITTFSDKSNGSAARTFYSDNNDINFENSIKTAIEGNDNSKIFFYGSHGLSDAIKNMLKTTVFSSDKVWVTSADELWEYYHIYNNIVIGEPTYHDGILSFEVKVPTYKKNQFRELTINIPGVSNGSNCTTSGATVVTGGAKQGDGQFTVNLGLEDKILYYIDELTQLYRTTPTNLFARRDAQYLINLLWDADVKAQKQAALGTAPPTVTLTAENYNGNELLKNTSVTLTATATLNGGDAIAKIQFQQISGTSESPVYTTVSETANAATATYTFTPTEAGTLMFRAVAVTDNNGELTGVSDNFTINVVNQLTIEAYTLNLIDKSGNTVFKQTVSREQWSADPLDDCYRSPYAKNYKYYNTATEAINNSGETLTDNIDSWTNADVYVGYDVDEEKFSEEKSYAIIANNRYMHSVFQPQNSNNHQNKDHNAYSLQNQKYDVANYGKNTAYTKNEVSTANLPFVDNSYIWTLGNDPYNFTILNKATPLYVKTNYNANPILLTESECAGDETKMSRYALIYWRNKNAGTVDKNVAYCRIYERGSSAPDNLNDDTNTSNHYLACSNDGDGQWRSIDGKYGNFDNFAKVLIKELPQVSLNILNAGKEVEYQMQAYFNQDAAMPNFCPFYLYRAYTSGQTFYYDQQGTDPVTAGQNVDSQKVQENGGVYITYTLDNDSWNKKVTDANTLILKSLQEQDESIQWYFMRAAGYNDDFIAANSDAMPSTMKNRQNLSRINTDLDGNTSKLAQWAFVGTPYCLKIMNRYFGALGYVGINSNAQENSEFMVYESDAEGIITEWEALSGLNQSNKLFFRPKGSANGTSPYLYLGWNGGKINMTLTSTAGGNQALDFTHAAETENKSLDFRLYDKNGSDMQLSQHIAGVKEGESFADLFQSTNLPRQFCSYQFYSDDTFSTPAESVGNDQHETIYVKWDYNEDAPVFSKGDDTDGYQYYMVDACLPTGSSNYYKYKFTIADSDDGQILTNDNGVSSILEYRHQFAFYGTPYGYKLFSRYAGKFIGVDDNNKLYTVDDPEEAITFEMPASSLPGYRLRFKVKGKESFVQSQAGNVWLGGTTEYFNQISNIVVPVRVFKQGKTASEDMVDYRQYALPYPEINTERITPDMLNASNSVGVARDFIHAFCDYKYYYTYDSTTGTLSNAIPVTGNFAGIPFYGGSEQYKRAFYATYTVDQDQFGKEYLIKPYTSETYFGLGGATSALTRTASLNEARADNTLKFRWLLLGDPYDLTICNEAMGEYYQNYPLSAEEKEESNGIISKIMTVNNNGCTFQNFEIIKRNDGGYVFYSLNTTDRLTSCISSDAVNLFVTNVNGKIQPGHKLDIIPATPEYNITWQIVDQYNQVVDGAAQVDENVSEGKVLSMDDMPVSLKRQFCEYTLYDNETCTTQLDSYKVTATKTLYVKINLMTGAPTFYQSLDTYTNAASKETANIRFANTSYVYDNNGILTASTDKESTEVNTNGKWVLIGSPYNVQFYNPETQKYIAVNTSNIQHEGDNGIITTDTPDAEGIATMWEFFIDASGLKTAVCLNDDNDILYMGSNGKFEIHGVAEDADPADFLCGNGVDGPTLILHYGAQTLRINASGQSMAGMTETIHLDGFFRLDRSLTTVIPEQWKRPFCKYTYTYNNNEVTAITQAMCDSTDPVQIDVSYEMMDNNECGFEWSNPVEGTATYHWYYMVNHHIQGRNGGYMLYQDGESSLRVTSDYMKDWLYTYNYQWSVIGDPYGFKLLCRYDPDGKFDRFFAVDENDNSMTFNESGNHLYEMRNGNYAGYFWMHPIYKAELLSQQDQSIQGIGVDDRGTRPVLLQAAAAGNFKSRTNANYRLTELNTIGMEDYVRYAGFVGALTAEAVKKDETLSQIKTLLDESGSITEEQALYIKDAIEKNGNTVEMKQGYYRIIPYVYEKGENISSPTRLYVSGYLYGEGTGSENQEYYPASPANSKGLAVRGDKDAAVYDPSTIFFFKQQEVNGDIRYQVSTQGLNLNGAGLTSGEAFNSAFAPLGFGFMQLKTKEGGNLDYNYLATATAWDDTKRISLTSRNPFETYHFTRLYLQPVGQGYNELDFRLKINPGHANTPKSNLPYSYTSIYVPYDIQIAGGIDKNGNAVGAEDCDALPFIGVEEHYHQEYSESEEGYYYKKGEYALFCKSIDEYNTNGSKQFIPAGTPVIIRSLSGMKELNFIIPNWEEGPSAAIQANVLRGEYLSVGNTNENIYIFGKESTTEGGTKTYTGRVGLFPRTNSSTPLTHNKINYIPAAENGGKYRMFSFDEKSNPVGICTPTFNEVMDYDEIYDLQGRKINKIAQPGVYIINHKKIYIK